MLFKITTAEKSGQSILLKTGYRAGIKPQTLAELAHQLRRQHQVADPDGWSNGLGEGVEVDHLPRMVYGLEGGDGAARQAKLAVVVVFNEIASLLRLRPFQQRLTTGNGDDRSGGKVVGGR